MALRFIRLQSQPQPETGPTFPLPKCLLPSQPLRQKDHPFIIVDLIRVMTHCLPAIGQGPAPSFSQVSLFQRSKKPPGHYAGRILDAAAGPQEC
jgi:hypothetical protein